jgi:hypothetical protein
MTLRLFTGIRQRAVARHHRGRPIRIAQVGQSKECLQLAHRVCVSLGSLNSVGVVAQRTWRCACTSRIAELFPLLHTCCYL